MFRVVIIVYSFSLLHGFLLYEYVTMYLTILQLMNVWVVFSGGLLQTMLLAAVMYMYVHFCGIVYPGVELLGLGLACASYCQIIFQSSSITYTLSSGI